MLKSLLNILPGQRPPSLHDKCEPAQQAGRLRGVRHSPRLRLTDSRLWVPIPPGLRKKIIYRVRQQTPDAQNFNSKETFKNRFKTH